MSALPAAPLAPCRDPHCRTCRGDRPLADVIDMHDRLRPTRPAPSIFWRRRAAVLGALLVIMLAATAGISRLVAAPAAVPPVGGTAVLEPGDTLWDLAVDTTPTGSDVRTTLRDIQVLNGFDSASVPAWTVVLLPATD